MNAVRIYSDASGETRFGEIELPEKCSLPVTGAILVDTRGPFERDWHTATARQLVIVMEGVMEMESGTGETFRLTPGRVALMENTSGRGHRTRWVKRGRSVTIPVGADFDAVALNASE